MTKKRLADLVPEQEPSPEDVEVPVEGLTRSLGVTLKESEIELLDRIAGELEVSRNNLMRYGLRYFLAAYLAGRVDAASDVETPRKPRKRLRMS